MISRSRAAICVTLTLFISFLAVAEQHGSTRELPEGLDATQIRNLYLAGKVWGYLKYHHPTVTAGCRDWDGQLLQSIPEILRATDDKQATSELSSWIDQLDYRDVCENDFEVRQHLAPRSIWIGDEALLGSTLADRLQSFDAVRTGGQHYTSQNPGGTPIFENEPSYGDVEQVDWRYKLLALYRFWNIVEYWFPYRDVIDEDWDEVLMDSIPRFYSAESRTDYLLELARLFARVNDGHASVRESIYVRPPGGRKSPPFSIRMVEGKPFVWRSFDLKEPGDAHSKAADQLHFGDIIVQVDGKPVEELFREASPYIGASNEVSRDRLIAQFLLNGKTDSVDVRVERGGQLLDITNRRLPRESLDINVQLWHDRDGDTFQFLSDEVAYLKLSAVDSSKTAEYINAARGTRGMVIDIRSYPSSFVVFALGQHLTDVSTPFARFTRANLSKPGSFLWMQPMVIQPAEPHYEGRIVILVDEDSQSQSEYTTMAFRAAPNAVVVGSQTAGMDGNVTRIPLPGGYIGWMSGIGVFYPDKTATQRIGIIPDIEVRPSIAGLRAGRDEVLEVAIRQILGENTPESRIRDMAAFETTAIHK